MSAIALVAAFLVGAIVGAGVAVWAILSTADVEDEDEDDRD